MSESKQPRIEFQNKSGIRIPLDAWWSEPQPTPQPEVATSETCHHCGEPMVERSGIVSGYLILDCPGCGHVKPVAVSGKVDQ